MGHMDSWITNNGRQVFVYNSSYCDGHSEYVRQYVNRYHKKGRRVVNKHGSYTYAFKRGWIRITSNGSVIETGDKVTKKALKTFKKFTCELPKKLTYYQVDSGASVNATAKSVSTVLTSHVKKVA